MIKRNLKMNSLTIGQYFKKKIHAGIVSKVVMLVFLLAISISCSANKDSLYKVYRLEKNLDKKLDAILNVIHSGYDKQRVKNDLDKLLVEVTKTNRKEFEAKYYYVLGDFMSTVNDQESAVKNYLKSLKICEANNFRNLASSSGYKIGRYYFYKGETKKSLKYIKISDSYTDQDENPGQAAMVKMVLGVIYQNLNKIDSSIHYQLEGLNIKRKYGLETAIPVSLNNISEAYFQKGDSAKAMRFLDSSIVLSSQLKLDPELYYAYFVKALNYNEKGRYKEAIPLLEKSRAHWEKLNSLDDLFKCYGQLSRAYAGTNDYKSALEMYQLQWKINDTLFNIAKMNNLADVEAKYQNEKKELQIAKHKSEIDLVESQKKNQLTVFLLIALFLVVDAIILYRRYKKQKKDKELIALQKIQLEVRNKDIEDSISYSSKVQQAIFPSIDEYKSCFKDSFVLFQPKEKVSGDFYWLEKKDNVTMVAAADCTGHGVPGALVSVVCCTALNRSVNEFNLRKPGQILDKTRALVIETFTKGDTNAKDGMDISLCCLEPIDANTTKLLWAGANNPLWMIKKGTKEVMQVDPEKQPIGKHAANVPYTTHEFVLHSGDLIYLFTDGFADQFGGEKGKKLKASRMKELLVEVCEMNLTQQHDYILKKFEEWRGDLEQIDDVCIIGIKL